MGTEYISVLLFIISLIIGIVIGSLLLLLIFHMQNRAYSKRKIKILKKRQNKKEQMPQKVSKKKEKVQKKAKKTHIDNREQINKPKSRLRQKLEAKEGSSWTEFNCDADEINQHDYIKRIRKREDNAYQYVKRLKTNDGRD